MKTSPELPEKLDYIILQRENNPTTDKSTWNGVDTRTSESVTVELVCLSGNSLDDFNAAQAELELQQAVKIPYVRRLVDFAARENICYFVYENTNFQTLQQCKASQSLLKKNISAYKRFFYQLVVGLNELHRRNIVCGDISLDNILLAPDITSNDGFEFYPVIKSYGSQKQLSAEASQAEQSHDANTIDVCTAPEQLKDRTLRNFKTDIWQLGIVLYELVNGCKLSENLITCQFTDHIFDSHVTLRSKDNESQLQSLFCGLTDINADKRFTTQLILGFEAFKDVRVAQPMQKVYPRTHVLLSQLHLQQNWKPDFEQTVKLLLTLSKDISQPVENMVQDTVPQNILVDLLSRTCHLISKDPIMIDDCVLDNAKVAYLPASVINEKNSSASDAIWQLGACILFALTNKNVFSGTTVEESARIISQCEPTLDSIDYAQVLEAMKTCSTLDQFRERLVEISSRNAIVSKLESMLDKACAELQEVKSSSEKQLQDFQKKLSNTQSQLEAKAKEALQHSVNAQNKEAMRRGLLQQLKFVEEQHNAERLAHQKNAKELEKCLMETQVRLQVFLEQFESSKNQIAEIKKEFQSKEAVFVEQVESVRRQNAELSAKLSWGDEQARRATADHMAVVERLQDDIHRLSNQNTDLAGKLAFSDGYLEKLNQALAGANYECSKHDSLYNAVFYDCVPCCLRFYGQIKSRNGTIQKTALMIAAEFSRINATALLVSEEQKMQDIYGKTALMGAAAKNESQAVDFLIPFEKCMQDNDGNTALIEASTKCHASVVESLIPHEKGIVNKYGKSALMYAAASGEDEIVDLLIPHEKQMKDKKGLTAMMKAAAQGHLGCLMKLTPHEKGQKDFEGKNALYHAYENGQKSCACFLWYIADEKAGLSDAQREEVQKCLEVE